MKTTLATSIEIFEEREIPLDSARPLKEKDGRMLRFHEGWKHWLALNSNNLAWIVLVSGGILFTSLLMK